MSPDQNVLNQAPADGGHRQDADVTGAPTERARSSHRFDPVSAGLGIAACLGGVVTTLGAVDPFDVDDFGAWCAGAAIAVGISLLPWGRRSAPTGES